MLTLDTEDSLRAPAWMLGGCQHVGAQIWHSMPAKGEGDKCTMDAIILPKFRETAGD